MTRMPRDIHKTFPVGPDLYALLFIGPRADDAEVRSAYRRAALSAHPDRGGTKERFHAIAAAFEVLSCPARRNQYDHHQTSVISGGPAQCSGHDSSAAPVRGNNRCAEGRRRFARVPAARKAKRVAPFPRSDALELLRMVLQQMDPTDRQRAAVELVPTVRSSLMAFMKKRRSKPTHLHETTKARGKGGHAAVRSSLGGTTAVIPIKGSKVKRYQGQLQIGSLRFYTREHTSIETAIDHQMVLVQIRSALAQASAGNSQFWHDHSAPLAICTAVIRQSGIPEATLRLRCFVQMRAAHWLTRDMKVTSPAGTLASGIQAHSRMIRARATSWSALREEWVPFLQKRRRLSLSDAQAFVDTARRECLQQQFAKAAANAEKALARKRAQCTSRSQESLAKSRHQGAGDVNKPATSSRMMGA